VTLEIVAPVVLVATAVVVVLWTQVLAPRRARRAVARTLAARGWATADSEAEPAFAPVMALAVAGTSGAQRTDRHDERFGPLTVPFESRETRRGRTLSLHRHERSRRPRYAACGLRATRSVSRAGGLLPGSRTRASDAPELWIGEAVRWAVAEPQLVFSATAEAFGDAARAVARRREVGEESIPALRSPSAHNPTLALREVLLRTPTAQRALACVYVAPGAWVLTAPLGPAAARLNELLTLADELAAAVDAVA